MTNPPEPGGVVIGLAFAALGAYALYTGEASWPYIAGFMTAKKKDHVTRYWLVVVGLFLVSGISFLQAFGFVVI
jgi:nitrate reductase NapE component